MSELWAPLGEALFRLPFITGILLAVLLPALGAWLLLRDEWLAALGLTHLAAAGALCSLVWGMPSMLGGCLGALIGGMLKTLVKAQGNEGYGFMVLGGWAILLLIAANTPGGAALGHALHDGQLYLTGVGESIAAALLLTAVGVAWPWLERPLLRARLLPEHERANALPAWRWHLGFEWAVAASLALGVATFGLMAAFAAAFAPAWLAFRWARGWRWTVALAVLLGVSEYAIAFILALRYDQPFGPVFVAVAVVGVGSEVLRRSLIASLSRE